MKEKIGIIGIGKLGLCFALNLEQAGFEVIGVDKTASYVKALNDKELGSYEPGLVDLLKLAKNFHATTELQAVLQEGIQQVFVLVATPSTPEGGYDHGQLEALADDLITAGKRENNVDLVISCTTMPGYCDTLAKRLAPYNYRLSYNPEFIAQGTIIRDQQRPDMILIGEADKVAGDLIEKTYRQLCQNEPTFCRMNRLSAEITKLSINCFLTTKISFANAIGDLCEKSGADTKAVLTAIGKDTRIGRKYLNYGFGFGGPCLPRDNRALGQFALQQGYPLLLGQVADEVNRRHLDFQVDWYLAHYKEEEIITFDYVTYKQDSILLEESQQLALAVRLAQTGRKVRVKGPAVVLAELEKRYGELLLY